jgi:hypothetical protein
MKELNLLESMWGPKVRRKTKLIVPLVTYENNRGSLNNKNWAYNVSYAFRDALDIKYELRVQNKISSMEWTQGPILSFKQGDVFHSKAGDKMIQVRFANQMGWDANNNKMYQGSVVFSEFLHNGNLFNKSIDRTVTQMQFLQLLISGHCSDN